MDRRLHRRIAVLVFAAASPLQAGPQPARAQTPEGLRVFISVDMEGIDESFHPTPLTGADPGNSITQDE